jgi:hypothetical protein
MHLGPLWEAFHKMGLCWRTLGLSCLMIVMFNGSAMDSDRVTIQCLCRVNMMYSFMLSNTQIPDISVVHKQVKVEMEDGSKPLHKFTRETEGAKELFLFDVVTPTVLGIWASSTVVFYRTDNKEAGILITKINRSVASCFLDTGPKFASTSMA